MPASERLYPVSVAYRFDVFEVRVAEQILLHRGKRIRIQDLPFKMLLILLERPGEIVSKEALRDRLWGQETFVEVDKGLYVLAAKVREALGDDASVPRFIRTVSGKGYRFIAKVDLVFDSMTTTASNQMELPPQPDPEHSPENVQSPLLTPLRKAFLFVSVLLVAGLGAFLAYGHYGKPLVGGDNSIVVGGFANATGNPDLENALSSAFRLKLQESPYLNLVPDTRFRGLINDPDSAPSRDQVNACATLDGQVLLTGRLNSRPQGYRVFLMAWRCKDGKLLASESSDANSQFSLLSALDQATVQLRRRLGESKKSVDEFNVPSIQATTSSIAALKAFSLGEEKRFQGLKQDALTAYKLAVDLDPQFAMAYARLGSVYRNMAEPTLSREFYKRAFDLRDRTTDRERLYIITHYYESFTGEINRAIEDYELWHTLYPRDVVPANNLAIEYLVAGTPEKSIDLAQTAVRLNPHDHFLYATLAQAYLKNGDYSHLRSLCDDPDRNNTDISGFHVACFESAFAEGDEWRMQREMLWAKGKPEESKLFEEAASVAVYRGKLAEAERLFSAARHSALQHNSVSAAALVQLDEATLEAELGLTHEAKENVLDALRAGSGNPVEEAVAAFALARANAISAAQSKMKDAAAKAPSDTLINSAVLASVRALIQLQQHHPKAAIQSLEETRPFDFCDSMDLSPPYLRGLAYLDDGDFGRAAKEFQRVLDHRAILPTSVYIVLSQLELGRSFELAGDREKANRIFRELSNLWKDADRDFPPLKRLQYYEHHLAEARSSLKKEMWSD